MFTFQGKMNEWYNYQAFKATAKFEISQQCYFNPSYAFLLLKAVKFLRNTQESLSSTEARKGGRKQGHCFQGQRGKKTQAGDKRMMPDKSKGQTWTLWEERLSKRAAGQGDMPPGVCASRRTLQSEALLVSW